MKINLEQKSESDGHQSYMLNAGLDETEYFQMNIGHLQEKRGSVSYIIQDE